MSNTDFFGQNQNKKARTSTRFSIIAVKRKKNVKHSKEVCDRSFRLL